MFYLTVGFIALAVYCVALTVVVRRDIKDIHKDSYQSWNAIRRCWDDIIDIRHILNAHFKNPDYVMPKCDKDNAMIDAHENEIQNLKANVEK